MTAVKRGLIVGGVALAILSGLIYWSSVHFNSISGRDTSMDTPEQIVKNGFKPFELSDLDGRNVSSSEFPSGKIRILHFWASWCGPCVEEFPSLLQFAKEHADKIEIIAISADENVKDAQTFVKAFGPRSANVRILMDHDAMVANAYGTHKLPESYLFNEAGVFRRKFTGNVNWASPVFQSIVLGTDPQ